MREFEAINSIRRLLGDTPPRIAIGIGDDAAVTRGGAFAVTSVDSVVDGVHFDRNTWTAEEIGWKAAAAAISDLAAMAAEPADLLVAAGLPSDIQTGELNGLFTGVASAAEAYGMTVIGGDTVASPVLWLSVTVVGYVQEAGHAVARSGGNYGDILVVTGSLGGARAGLELLQDDKLAARAGLSSEQSDLLTARQRRPNPQLKAAQALRRAGVRAMIDISDGLAGDLAHLAAASGCGAEVELADLPVEAATALVAGALGQDPAEFAAAGGEDYELLAAIEPENVEAARAALLATGTALTPIGKLVPSGPPRYMRPDGTDAKLESFEHLT